MQTESELGMVVYTYYIGTEEAETGKSPVSVASRPSLFSESYTQVRDPTSKKQGGSVLRQGT